MRLKHVQIVERDIKGAKGFLKGTIVHTVGIIDFPVPIFWAEDAGESLAFIDQSNHQNTTPLNTSDAIENFQSPYSYFGILHTYNHITTIPSFGTTEPFISQVQTLDDQNIA
ncbi:1262_t:CDS:2, partial [Dentiscutata erythropus]